MKGAENDIITSAIAADVREHGEVSIERINKELLKYSISADPGVLRTRIKDMTNADSDKKNG